jgi:hypothetical protein
MEALLQTVWKVIHPDWKALPVPVPAGDTASPHTVVEWPIPSPVHYRMGWPSNYNGATRPRMSDADADARAV